MVTKPSAADRLAATKAAIKRVEQQIDAATAHRLEVLRHHDANALVAINADRRREALKLLHRRLIDQVPLLEPLVGQEQQQQRRNQHPTDEPSARARLLVIEPWIVRWQAVPEVDRSAKFQTDLDGLVNERYRLNRLIESFAPRKMVAT